MSPALQREPCAVGAAAAAASRGRHHGGAVPKKRFCGGKAPGPARPSCGLAAPGFHGEIPPRTATPAPPCTRFGAPGGARGTGNGSCPPLNAERGFSCGGPGSPGFGSRSCRSTHAGFGSSVPGEPEGGRQGNPGAPAKQRAQRPGCVCSQSPQISPDGGAGIPGPQRSARGSPGPP